jgi:hypothetical protein
MNGPVIWEPIENAPKDGSVIYGFYPQGKCSELRADIRPLKWNGWGGGVWSCAVTGHHTQDAPLMFTRKIPYPDPREIQAIQQRKHQESTLRLYNVTSPDQLTPEQRQNYDWQYPLEHF